MNKQTSRYILIILAIIIVGLGIFYYFYNDIKINNEPFYAYQAYYTGEPIQDVAPTASNPVLFVSGLQETASNDYGLYAFNASNQICMMPKGTIVWACLPLTKDKQAAPVILERVMPTATNKMYLTESRYNCAASDGIMLAASPTALWYYNGGLNNSERVDCLYYMKLGANGMINFKEGDTFQCLQLPPATLHSGTTTTTTTTTQPGVTNPTTTPPYAYPLDYDKLRLIAVNNNILFGVGCTDGGELYYCNLTNGVPTNNGEGNWKKSVLPVAVSSVRNIMVNNTTIYVYYYDTNTNVKGIYSSPITVTGGVFSPYWTVWTKSSNGIASPLFNDVFNLMKLNNDVFWAKSSTKLWWRALRNGAPTPSGFENYDWKSIDISNSPIASAITNMEIVNDTLVLMSNVQTNNYSIPLKSLTTPTGPTTTGPLATGPTTTGPQNTGPTTTGPQVTGPTTTGPQVTGPTTTRPLATGPTTTGVSGSNNTTNDITNDTTDTTGTGGTGDNRMSLNDILQSMFGSMFNNNQSQSQSQSLYISPMNNESLYSPASYYRSGSGSGAKISSLFFPIVKID